MESSPAPSPATVKSSTAPSTAAVKSFSQLVDGFRIPGMFSADRYRSAVHYRPRDDDLFIVTYPKCGTTWCQHILPLIFRHGERPAGNLLDHLEQSPFLEFMGAVGAEAMRRPGAIKVHLPYHLTPRSDKAKYIYITRNPKDCLVSYYHHMKGNPGHGFYGSFDDFFEMFISGNIDYGDYYDHLLGWYEHRNDPNVLFMTYEELKADTKAAILKMATFIDEEKYAEPLRQDSQKLENVVRYSSFDYMKREVNKSIDDMFAMSEEDVLSSKHIPESVKEMFVKIVELKVSKSEDVASSQSQFIRKGIVGDWRNHLTPEQSKRMDDKFADRTQGTDIPSFWENMM